MSAFGVGTARGAEDDDTDDRMLDVILTGLRHGVTVIDTAVNYRRGRSERVVGQALRRAVALGIASRENVVIATKGGYVRPRGEVEPSAPAPEPHGPLDHCMAPACLRHQLDTSLETLGVEHIDLYYLHNPEEQRARHPADKFEDLMRRAFTTLEVAIQEGVISAYGVATWRARADLRDHPLQLASLKALAAEASGNADHFVAIEAPLSMIHQEALVSSHVCEGVPRSLPEVCARLGVDLVASASAGGGRVSALAAASARWTAAIPGVTTALIGTLNPDHLLAALDQTRPAAGS